VTEASGIFSEPLQNLATMVSRLATFQAWVGAVDAEAALQRVHIEGYDPADGCFVRPFCLVGFDTQFHDRLNYFGGTLHLCLEADIAEDDQEQHKDAAFGFANMTGPFLDELISESEWTGLFWPIRSIRSIDRQQRTGKDDTRGDYLQQWFRIEYGLESS
jgi:hypothetical protein